MTRIEGRTALITGAAGGLGRQLALRMAREGARLVLWDVDEVGLTETGRLVRGAGGWAHLHAVDVTDPAAVEAAAADALASAGAVEILVNNAGIISGERLLDLSDDLIDRTMRINAIAPLLVTKRFLPAMIERGDGHIVSISSAAGVVGLARLTAYCASKHAVVGFDDALQQELRTLDARVRTTLVCPYLIRTGLTEGARSKVPWLLPILEADHVADRIVVAVRRGRRRLLLPWFLRLVPLLRTLPPRATDPLRDLLGANQTMDDYAARREAATLRHPANGR